MTAQERAIKIALASRDKSQRWLADKLGTTPQNLNSRIKRGSLKDEEMMQIAGLLNMEWKAGFVEKE
jgi:DNA-binding MarR family transcriptional regulator